MAAVIQKSRRVLGARAILLAVVATLLVPTPGRAEHNSGGCSDTYVCLFEHSSWNHNDSSGAVKQFRECNVSGDSNCDWQSLVNYAFNDKLSSYYSKRVYDAKWAWNSDGSGTRYCMESLSSSSQVPDNDEASAVKIFDRDDVC